MIVTLVRVLLKCLGAKVVMVSQRNFRGYPSNQRCVVEAVSLAQLIAGVFSRWFILYLIGKRAPRRSMVSPRFGILPVVGVRGIGLKWGAPQ